MKITNPNKTVVEAAKERMEYVFDNFENIVVSISGGKDSLVLAYLALLEAEKRDRKVQIFFLDEEVVYQSTIEQVEYIMNLKPNNTIKLWYKIPFNLTNATSVEEGQLISWDPNAKKNWMRPTRKQGTIIIPPWGDNPKIADKNKGFGFYDAMTNFELSHENTAFLVGLRASESKDRFRAMISHPGFKDILWSTGLKYKTTGNVKFYPIYDWEASDVFRFCADEKLQLHKFYDFKYRKGYGTHEMRVSSLIHEKSFKAINELPEFEPKTYSKLLKRIKGISFAQETAKAKEMFGVKTLPKNYKTWKEYRDFLITTHSDKERLPIFLKRFKKHRQSEYIYQQQCKQLLLNDYENNFNVKNKLSPKELKIEFYRENL